MHVTQLAIYPIKSTRQIPISSAKVTRRGFENDRRWLLVDEQGRFLTQRQHPTMALIATKLQDNGLTISRPDAANLQVTIPTNTTPTTSVTVWNDNCQALDAGDEAAAWFSDFLHIQCRLMYQPESAIRPTAEKYSQPGDHTSFADGFPFLLTNGASLQELNGRLDTPLPMTRFRPNIVISGGKPFEEDQWQQIRIGNITFRVVKPCSRCVMTTVNPETGEREGIEPLATLTTYRRTDMGVLFGQNLIPNQEGIIQVGDQVSIIG